MKLRVRNTNKKVGLAPNPTFHIPHNGGREKKFHQKMLPKSREID